MAKIDFGGVVEEVITSEEFPLKKAGEVLKNETITVLGYGVQGPAQALNLKDNGFEVIIGQMEGDEYWDRAVADGFVPGKTLFSITEAARKGTIVINLLSDAGQVATWPQIKECLNEGDALYFSHGFSIVYKDQTGVIPPKNIDVVMVAPKGSGGPYVPISLTAAASIPASRCTRTLPEGRKTEPLPSASGSDPGTCFRRPLKKRFTATSPGNGGF